MQKNWNTLLHKFCNHRNSDYNFLKKQRKTPLLWQNLPKKYSKKIVIIFLKKQKTDVRDIRFLWSFWPDLNRRPIDYESIALPTEPQKHARVCAHHEHAHLLYVNSTQVISPIYLDDKIQVYHRQSQHRDQGHLEHVNSHLCSRVVLSKYHQPIMLAL